LQQTIESAESAPEAAAGGEAAPGGAQPAPSSAAAARPAPRPAKPVSGLSLLFRALLDRLKRLFGRG
jgi:hypothetical protein